MTIETAQLKEKMIKSLQAMNVFIANNQGTINEKKLAMVQEAFSNLEEKMRTAFHEDDELSRIIEDFEKEVQEQESYIKKQESRIENMVNTNGESGDNDSDTDNEAPDDILTY